MSYRSILVHIDSAEASPRLDLAIALARTHDAELLGAYVMPDPGITPFTSALMPSGVAEQHLQEDLDAEQVAEAHFRAACSEAGLAALAWRSPAGDPFQGAVLQARHCDLALLAQPLRDRPNGGFMAELANAVLSASGRPVLFVPESATGASPPAHILIAWKDTREAARAVHDALPLLKRAKSVRAVTIADEEEETLREHLTETLLAQYLSRHAVQATVTRIAAVNANPGEALLSHIAEVGADMLVMGGNSRPRISELVFGGVTQLVLSSMSVPVLMSH